MSCIMKIYQGRNASVDKEVINTSPDYDRGQVKEKYNG